MSVKMKTDADFENSLEYHKEVAENYREAYADLKAKADKLFKALCLGIVITEYYEGKNSLNSISMRYALADYKGDKE